MSSLSEASIGDLEEDKPKESLKAEKPPTILHKNWEVISSKDMTMENVQPAKANQMFGDLQVRKEDPVIEEKPVIATPQIAEELLKEVSFLLIISTTKNQISGFYSKKINVIYSKRKNLG